MSGIRVTLEDFVTYKEKSLLQLQAIKIISELSDSQLEGFCQLMSPSIEKDIET